MTQPKAYRPKEFCEAYNIGLSKFYKEVRAKRLPVKKIGRASLVSAEAAAQWFNSLPVKKIGRASLVSAEAA